MLILSKINNKIGSGGKREKAGNATIINTVSTNQYKHTYSCTERRNQQNAKPLHFYHFITWPQILSALRKIKILSCWQNNFNMMNLKTELHKQNLLTWVPRARKYLAQVSDWCRPSSISRANLQKQGINTWLGFSHRKLECAMQTSLPFMNIKGSLHYIAYIPIFSLSGICLTATNSVYSGC